MLRQLDTCPAAQVYPMLRTTALLAALCGASGTAVELTSDNFDKEITQSGKAAFIKFLATW
jgi:protein disulfide-isomerase A6